MVLPLHLRPDQDLSDDATYLGIQVSMSSHFDPGSNLPRSAADIDICNISSTLLFFAKEDASNNLDHAALPFTL